MLSSELLNSLSKKELISVIESLESSRNKCNEEEIEKMLKESMLNEAYMESHRGVDYGYGIGVYGAL